VSYVKLAGACANLQIPTPPALKFVSRWTLYRLRNIFKELMTKSKFTSLGLTSCFQLIRICTFESPSTNFLWTSSMTLIPGVVSWFDELRVQCSLCKS
jgi:hypothetical protein